MAEHLPGLVVHGDGALVENHKTGGKAGDILHAVGDVDHRAVDGGMIAPDIENDLFSSPGIETGGGLVQDQHVGPHGNDAGDGGAALLPAGQIEGRLIQHIRVQADEIRRLQDPLVDLRLVQLHILRPVGDVRADGLLKELVLRVLEHKAHLGADLPCAGSRGEYLLSLHQNAAGGGLQKPVQMLDKGGFSGTGMADDADELPPGRGKIHVLHRDVFKRGAFAVNMRQLFCLNERRQASRSPLNC